METVKSCCRVKKKIRPTQLQPIMGSHNAFSSLQPRVADNKYDNWCPDYLEVLKRVEKVNEDIIDRHLGKRRQSRPSIRQRVQVLVTGGHLEPKTIKYRNVASSADGSPHILITCDCLSSTTSVMHTLHAVFEEKSSGEYVVDLSSCSCKKGELFCSHSIGFLYLISIICNY